jgi:septal ring factor EnvC (AmiA/AmiB activator)
VPNIAADPEELKNLAKTIAAAGQHLETIRTQVTKAIANSGWNDAERQKFEQQIAADLKTIGAISERFKTQYRVSLERKARALEDFRR